MKFDIFNFVFIMVLLYFGGFLASYLSGIIPFFATGGWLGGILIGMIQMILLVFVGLATGKMSLWTILFGGILIFVGGILGGYVAGFVNVSGLYATVLTLAIQTLMLTFVGVVKGGGKAIPLKGK